MPQALLYQTFLNILQSQQSQHSFTQNQFKFIVQTIICTDRKDQTIQKQLQSIVKQLQEKTNSEGSTTKMFRPYELEWVMNWLVQVYYKHVKLINAYEVEVESEKLRSERKKQSNKNEQNNDCELMQLLIDTPVFVEPLSKAKLIRDGAQLIIVD